MNRLTRKIGHVAMLLLMLGVSSCGGNRQQKDNERQLVGNDKDSHGCIGSAGYRWSEAKKACIRPWEEGQKYVSGANSAYLVFSYDSSVVEVFVTKAEGILCRTADKKLWKSADEKVQVSFVDAYPTLTIGNEIYSAK